MFCEKIQGSTSLISPLSILEESYQSIDFLFCFYYYFIDLQPGNGETFFTQKYFLFYISVDTVSNDYVHSK